MDRLAYLNRLSNEILEKLSEEVGGLLGQDFTVDDITHGLRSRDEIYAPLSGKQVLSTLTVSGDAEGLAYVVIGLKDAITLGGTLILLPPDEMAARRKKQLFDGEVSDAYGEIANIMAGVYTAVFIEHADPKLHFKKTELKEFTPSPSDSTIPPGAYYTCSGQAKMDGAPLGPLSILIPPQLLKLPLPGGVDNKEEGAAPASPEAPRAIQETSGPIVLDSEGLLMVVSETQQSAEAFARNFSDQCRCNLACLHFQEDFPGAIQGRKVLGVFLAMREVGERGLASIIKIQSAVGEKTPLIAAGPEWTRKTVLQAVKYGARDILVTPANSGEILVKIRQHMQEQSR
ncbi:hypothetical protein [Trichloromonas sp.]|uniref:hypothetical protein n=1 Tax=Trichloromonas sp. TaxID=3069249 RepID=UPI002A433561|nr:hypothetical protein [Trichloromonas sp.]